MQNLSRHWICLFLKFNIFEQFLLVWNVSSKLFIRFYLNKWHILTFLGEYTRLEYTLTVDYSWKWNNTFCTVFRTMTFLVLWCFEVQFIHFGWVYSSYHKFLTCVLNILDGGYTRLEYISTVDNRGRRKGQKNFFRFSRLITLNGSFLTSLVSS